MSKSRTENKKSQIVSVLKSVGENGITNIELSKIALRYGGYLGYLYKDGYKISKENLGNGVFKYKLISEPSEILERSKALDVLFAEIEKVGGISKETITKILDDNLITVRYKANTYNN